MVRVLTWPPVTVIKDVMGVADHVNELEDGVLDNIGVDEGEDCEVDGCEIGGCEVDDCEVDGCEVDGCSEELNEEDGVCVAGVIVKLVTGV